MGRLDALDVFFPPRGPCGLCGHHDARHRIWDAMIGRSSAGESVKDLASDYDLTPAAVQAVLDERPYQDPLKSEAT